MRVPVMAFQARRILVASLMFVVIAAAACASVYSFASPAQASDYPRRIAVAPFTSYAKEDISATVAVLPRLVSSRLMALAGADVSLLKASGKPAADAAKDAKYPLLLEGTVAKLGKGYSIDVIVTDLAAGKNAGAFFAAAATEDDIIAQIGVLSGEIAEKIFGVQGAVRAASPVPVAAASQPGVHVAPGAPGVVVTAPPTAAPATAAQPQPQATTPAAPLAFMTTGAPLSDGWIPASIKRISMSDRIADELNGVVTINVDPEGNAIVAAFGKTVIYFYTIKGEEILPYTRIRRQLGNHILSVDAFDIDGDGEKEILVTNKLDESIQSLIYKKKDDYYEEIAERIRYYFAVLPDWKGKPTLVGQYQGVGSPFKGKIVTLKWDGKQLVPGEELPHNTNISPLADGAAIGLSSGKFGEEWRLIHIDKEFHIKVLEADGKAMYKSRNKHGARLDFFEWGPYVTADGGRKKYSLRMPARLAPGSGDTPFILTTELKKGVLDLITGVFESTRLVLFQWDVGEFVEKTGTQGTSQFISGADFISGPEFRKGDRIVATVIEQQGVLLRDQISRVLLYLVE